MTIAIRGGSCKTKFFTEIKVPPRFVAGHLLVVLPGFTRRLNGIDDARVAGAAAKMAVERFRDFFAVPGAVVLQQPGCPDHNAGNAKTALHCAFQQERLAQYATHVLGHAFERHYLVTRHVFRLAQARQHRLAIHQNRATAAHAFRSAAVLGGNNLAFFAEHFEKIHPRLVRNRGGVPV